MPEFLVEVYASGAASSLADALAADVSRAADELGREGTPVRLLRAISVPEEETCLYLYQADSLDTVQKAAARACLHVHHVSQAASSGPPLAGSEPSANRSPAGSPGEEIP
jgi:hypothetical protein